MRAQSLAGPGFPRSRGRRATGRSFASYQSLFVVPVGADRSLGFRKRLPVSRLPLRRRPLLNKLPVLDASKQLFSYFYILDEPFTATTFVVVLVHAGAAVYFGYGLSW